MNILVKLFGHYQNGRAPEQALSLPDECHVIDVAKLLNIPENSKGIILVNGQPSKMTHPLKNDDVVTFFPMVSGG